jgi:hypothetical protein
MSEHQARVAGGEAAGSLSDNFKKVLGINSGDFDKFLRHQKSYGFWVGQLFSDWPHFEQRKHDVIERTDTIISLFFSSKEALCGAYLSGNTSANKIAPDDVERALRYNKSIGKFLYDETYGNFAIESQEDGTSYTQLTFELPLQRKLLLTSSGDFWSEYTYKHPITGQPFHPDEVQRAEIEDALEQDLETLHTAIGFQLTTRGYIQQR